jgi:hypothetical protein
MARQGNRQPPAHPENHPLGQRHRRRLLPQLRLPQGVLLLVILGDAREPNRFTPSPLCSGGRAGVGGLRQMPAPPFRSSCRESRSVPLVPAAPQTRGERGTPCRRRRRGRSGSILGRGDKGLFDPSTIQLLTLFPFSLYPSRKLRMTPLSVAEIANDPFIRPLFRHP